MGVNWRNLTYLQSLEISQNLRTVIRIIYKISANELKEIFWFYDYKCCITEMCSAEVVW
jgi:hypothetical protein